MKFLLNFIKEKIEYIENKNITFWNIITSVFIAIFLRTFFEGFLSQYTEGKIVNFVDYFFHYPLWYIGVFLSICIILTLITKENIRNVSKIFIYIPFIILIPPFIDFIINKGNYVLYSYISGSFYELFNFFISFGGYKNINTTTGIRFEIFLVLVLISFYLYIKTKNIKKVFIGILFSYFILFLFAITPTSIFYFSNLVNYDYNNLNISSVYDFYKQDFQNSKLSKNKTYILGLNKQKDLVVQEEEFQYSVIISFFLLIIDIALMAWFFWIYSRNKFIATIKNFRYLRVVYYFLFLSLGLYLGGFVVNSLFDFFSILSVFLALFFTGLYSVWENDEIDIEIDKISNKKRPLAQNIFSLKEWVNMKYIFLYLGLSFAFLNGFYSFIFILFFIFIYHIYSTPPLKLKRIIFLSSFLIALNAVIIILMGYFVTSRTESLIFFPTNIIFFILVSVFLIENIKNIKDIEGDRENGIKTIANILGEKISKLLFGFIISILMLFTPIVFYLNIKTILISTIFAIIMFLFINKKKFEEKYVFIIYFIFVFFFILSIFY